MNEDGFGTFLSDVGFVLAGVAALFGAVCAVMYGVELLLELLASWGVQ